MGSVAEAGSLGAWGGPGGNSAQQRWELAPGIAFVLTLLTSERTEKVGTHQTSSAACT